MEFIEELKSRLVDYGSISIGKNFECQAITADISVIIPVFGREEYNNPVSDYFYRATKYYQEHIDPDFRVSITIVEHSVIPAHRSICHPFVNYIHIHSQGKPFNKCLAFNVGAIMTGNCKRFLFHDLDIIVPENFFVSLMANIGNEVGPNYRGMQAFTKRRLLHADKEMTEFILKNKGIVSDFSVYNKNLHQAKPGAAGGSIFIDRESFINVGGWTDCFFTEYSIEDQFFFDKMQLHFNVGFADDPPVELIHLDHPPSFNRTVKHEERSFYDMFIKLQPDHKMQFFDIERDNLKKYINHDTFIQAQER